MSRFPKLTETFILYEILAMEALGARVEVYPLLREKERVLHPEAARMLPRVHSYPFVSFPILAAQWHFFRQRPREYFRLWFDVLRWTWGSANFFVGALGIFPKVVRFALEMERLGVRHVHAHFCNHPAVAALIIHRLTGIPFSFTAHGTDLHVERRMLDKKVEAAAFAVTVSEFNKAMMIQECGNGAGPKVHVVHCGIDPALFTPSPGRDGAGPLQILCVAMLRGVKGHKYLVEACRLLKERGVEFVCHFVGDGPLRNQIDRHIQAVGLKDQIKLHGGLPRDEVIRMMSKVDVVALASTPTKAGRKEGIPVSLMEAMASGLPVVATAITGIPELVDSGVSGLLVPPGNPGALADALQALERDAALRQKMGRAGREKVVREFNLPVNAQRLMSLFLGESVQREPASVPVSDPVTPGSQKARTVATNN
jgi:glycosyltransferase involved in cell wall biosynthesis